MALVIVLTVFLEDFVVKGLLTLSQQTAGFPLSSLFNLKCFHTTLGFGN